MPQKILIFGIGDFAELMYHYLRSSSLYHVVGFCADKDFMSSKTFCQLPVHEFENIESIFSPEQYKFFIAVGYSHMPARVTVYNKVKAKKYFCINYISPQAIVDESVSMGENNVIFPNVVIEPFVKIQNNNIIWSSSNICHNVEIESHSFIASQSLVGGFSKIGHNCFIGFNSTILHNVYIANETLVGAKSLVMQNTEPYSKYIGIPAEKVSTHEKGIWIK